MNNIIRSALSEYVECELLIELRLSKHYKLIQCHMHRTHTHTASTDRAIAGTRRLVDVFTCVRA